jgi:hypothetical protein
MTLLILSTKESRADRRTMNFLFPRSIKLGVNKSEKLLGKNRLAQIRS